MIYLELKKMKEAEKVCKSENTEGLKLQEKFSYSSMLDKILSRVNLYAINFIKAIENFTKSNFMIFIKKI